LSIIKVTLKKDVVEGFGINVLFLSICRLLKSDLFAVDGTHAIGKLPLDSKVGDNSFHRIHCRIRHIDWLQMLPQTRASLVNYLGNGTGRNTKTKRE